MHQSSTFKKTASLINAAHYFVEHVDASIISRLNMEALCRDVVRDALENKGLKGVYAAKYYSLPVDKRRRFIGNRLINMYGIATLPSSTNDACLQIPRMAMLAEATGGRNQMSLINNERW